MNPTPDFGNGEKATMTFVGSNVGDLPAMPVQGGHITAWEVTDEDLENLRKHRRVYLWVLGAMHPPVAVFTEPPPPSSGPALRNGEA